MKKHIIILSGVLLLSACGGNKAPEPKPSQTPVSDEGAAMKPTDEMADLLPVISATGSSPAWSIKTTQPNELAFSSETSSDKTTLKVTAYDGVGQGMKISGVDSAGKPFTLVLDGQTCRDNDSGRDLISSAQLDYQGTSLQGCADIK